MKLKNQVTSLSLSKKLKKLGVKQESLFYWQLLYPDTDPRWVISYKDSIVLDKDGDETYSAFTVAELGEMLPLNKINCYKASDKKNTYYFDLEDVNQYIGEATTEANARAKCLIYLKERGLIK